MILNGKQINMLSCAGMQCDEHSVKALMINTDCGEVEFKIFEILWLRQQLSTYEHKLFMHNVNNMEAPHED